MKPAKVNWTKVREFLLERSKGYCEVSGRVLDPATFDVHHRRNKGMGGTSRPDRDALWNLLAVDPATHNAAARGERSIHGSTAWSNPCGYLLYQTEDPAVREFLLHGREWVKIGPDGHYL